MSVLGNPLSQFRQLEGWFPMTLAPQYTCLVINATRFIVRGSRVRFLPSSSYFFPYQMLLFFANSSTNSMMCTRLLLRTVFIWIHSIFCKLHCSKEIQFAFAFSIRFAFNLQSILFILCIFVMKFHLISFFVSKKSSSSFFSSNKLAISNMHAKRHSWIC